MEYLVLTVIAVPAALLFLLVLALATGAINERGDIKAAALGLRHSWDSLVRRR